MSIPLCVKSSTSNITIYGDLGTCIIMPFVYKVSRQVRIIRYWFKSYNMEIVRLYGATDEKHVINLSYVWNPITLINNVNIRSFH